MDGGGHENQGFFPHGALAVHSEFRVKKRALCLLSPGSVNRKQCLRPRLNLKSTRKGELLSSNINNLS